MDPLILLVEPELDERAATATMSRAQRVYEQGARDINRIMREQLTQGAEMGGRAVEDAADKARRAYLSMGDAAEKVAAAERKADAAREKGAANAEALGRKVERARLDEIQAIEKATAAYREYENAAQNAGRAGDHVGHGVLAGLRGAATGVRSAGDEMASGFLDGFAGSSALMRLGPAISNPVMAAVVAVGVVGGKVLADNINAGMRQLQIQDVLQAQLGASTADAARYASSAAKSYTDMFGSSVADNMQAIQFGMQSGVITPGSSDAEIQKTIADMQTLHQVMGVDMREAARASGQLIRGGFAKDGTEAADIIATGFQHGLDISGDWLDTITEYSTQFRKLGLDGADAIGLISQGLEGAARNSDVVADSLKEFSIRAVDGSKSTAEGFAGIGFKADEMAQKILAGGDSARAAFGATLEAIKSLNDPQQQALVWADLFGTQWEDMGAAINKFDLSKARSEFSNTDGAIDDMTNKLATHTSGWDSMGRSIDTTFGKLQKWLADTDVGRFFSQGLPGALSEKFDALAAQIDGTKLGPNGEYTGVPALPGRPLFPQGPGTTMFGPPSTVSGNPLDIITGGVTGADLAPGSNFYKDWYKPAGTTPDGSPIPGAPTPILTETQQAAKDEAEKAAKGGGSLPPAPVLPLQYTNTAGMPSSIASATARYDESRHEVAEKEARVNQLLQSNLADESDRQKARNDLAKAQQDELRAEQSLTDARIKATQQSNQQLGKLSGELTDFGNKLDADFGISKGLGGIVENFVKAAGNILAAPFLQALGMISKANPNEGSGIIGIAAANGAFGSQYTPSAIAAAQQRGVSPGYSGSYPAGAYPGDAALLSMVPKGIGQYDNVTKDLSKGLVDCASGVEDLVNILDGKSTAGGSLWTGNASSVLPGMGFQPGMGGPGDFRIGYNSGHMQATLPGGTNVNFGSTSAIQAGGLDGGAGAYDPSFTDHWFRPVAGTPIGAPAATAPDIYGPANTDPGLTNPSAPGWTGPGIPSTIMPGGGGQGPVFGANPQGPGIGASAGLGLSPGMAYPSHGGNSGNIAGGLPLDAAMAATSVADMMLPGAGAAAKIGIQLANRTIGYGAQNLGILANAVGETLSVGDNPRGSIGSSWLGKLAGGLAGAAPALPNLAGGKKPPGPMTNPGGEAAKNGNVDNSQTNHITLQTPPNTSANTMSGMVAEQTRMHSTPGRQ